MNTQTPGPLSVCDNFGPTTLALFKDGRPKWDYHVADLHFAKGETFGQDHPGGWAHREMTKANARLLAASYTAFDKAGRELGKDAAALAESIDLGALIKAAREVVAELDHDTLGAGTSARVIRLESLLMRLENA